MHSMLQQNCGSLSFPMQDLCQMLLKGLRQNLVSLKGLCQMPFTSALMPCIRRPSLGPKPPLVASLGSISPMAMLGLNSSSSPLLDHKLTCLATGYAISHTPSSNCYSTCISSSSISS